MKVNLLKERQKVYSINWIEILVIISVVVSIVLMGVHYYFLYMDKELLEADINYLDNQLNILSVRVAEYNRLKAEVEELEAIKEKMDQLKYVWADALIELGFVIPEKALVNTLQIEETDLRLNGLALDNQRVLELVDNMNQSPVYHDVKIINLSQSNDVNYNISALLAAEEGEE